MIKVTMTQKMARPFQSKAAFLEFVRTTPPQNSIGNARWSNKDLEPTPPNERNWTWYNLPIYWFSSAFSTSSWNVAASLLATGLTWQQAFISCILGAAISGLVVVGMARPGAQYHIGYPVLCRSVMGMYGSYFFIFLRAVVGAIYYGVQTFYGANMLATCFTCMFGSAWKNFANALPLSASVTSKQFVCFFIFWIIEFPFMFVHPRSIHLLFTIKGIIMPIVVFALFGWCMAHGSGISAIGNKLATPAKGVPLGWSVMAGINAVMGTLSPMLVNQPDLSRYCKKVSDAGWHQGVAVFVAKTLVFFLGLATTASIQGAYGTAYWNIWDLLNAILARNWTPAGRTAIFLVSFFFLFATLATNLASNSIPFAADTSALLPRYFTIRRGQVMCAIIGFALVPWKLIASAQAFLSFLGSYGIFMAPLCSVIIVDYCFAKKGNIHVPSLYNGNKDGIYYYTYGTNWRGVFAWSGAVAFGLPGLIGSYVPSAVGQAAKNMYKMGWLLTFVVAAALYAACILIWPTQTYPNGYAEVPRAWEYMGPRDGFFDNERDRSSGDSEDTNSLEIVQKSFVEKADAQV